MNEEVTTQESHSATVQEAYDSLIESINNDYAEEETNSILSEEEQAILDQAVEEAHQEIPVNSTTMLTNDTSSRFSSAIWYDCIQQKSVTLAGIGGIGSYVAFLLARVRPKNIFMYDHDTVDYTNISGQLYCVQDVGTLKVEAMANMLTKYADYRNVFTYPTMFTRGDNATYVMICGFDNMIARKYFYNAWKELVNNINNSKRKECLFIDGRLAAEEFQILCIRGDDEFNMKRYESEFLFSDNQADRTICSYKQTSFCANMIASYIVNLFVNFCANQCGPLIDRDLPFFTSYNAETMYLKTEA